MKDIKTSLYLYSISSVVVLLARMLDFQVVENIIKPMIIPSIYFFYVQSSRTKMNYLESIILFLFFIGDMLIMLFPNDYMNIVLMSFSLGYIFIMQFILKDINFKILKIKALAYSVSLFILLFILLYFIIDLPAQMIINNHTSFFLYGLLLILIVVCSVYLYSTKTSFSTLNLLCMSLCFLISDLFYCIHKFILQNMILDILNLSAQFLSYYFVVKYFLSREVLTITKDKNMN